MTFGLLTPSHTGVRGVSGSVLRRDIDPGARVSVLGDHDPCRRALVTGNELGGGAYPKHGPWLRGDFR